MTLYGTSTPNSQVTLSINGQTVSATSDSTGRWQSSISLNGVGSYVVRAQSASGSVMSVTFQTTDTNGDGLPDTAAKDWIPYIAGVTLIMIGFILNLKIKNTKSKYN